MSKCPKRILLIEFLGWTWDGRGVDVGWTWDGNGWTWDGRGMDAILNSPLTKGNVLLN